MILSLIESADGFVVYLSEEQAKELVLLIIERLEVGRKSS